MTEINLIKLGIELPISCLKYIEDKSVPDNTFYDIEPSGICGRCDTYRQKYLKESRIFVNSLGYFQNDRFVEMLYWYTRESILKGAKHGED